MYDLLTFCEKLATLSMNCCRSHLFCTSCPLWLPRCCQLPCGPPAQLASSALRPLVTLLLPERPELTCILSLVTLTSVTLFVSLARCQHSKLKLYLSLLDLALRNTPELVINKTMIIYYRDTGRPSSYTWFF